MIAADTRHRRHRDGRHGSIGYTLLEMLLSLAIMTVLMGAMAVSLAVASRALDTGTGPVGQTRRAAETVEEIDADLAMALSFSERTSAAVTFTVPDRTGDGKPETIRYSWTGPDDGKLLRQVNGGSPAALAEDVQYFSLTYELKTVAADTSGDIKGKDKGDTGKDKDDKGKGKRDKGKDKRDKGKDKDDKGKDKDDKGKKRRGGRR